MYYLQNAAKHEPHFCCLLWMKTRKKYHCMQHTCLYRIKNVRTWTMTYIVYHMMHQQVTRDHQYHSHDAFTHNQRPIVSFTKDSNTQPESMDFINKMHQQVTSDHQCHLQYASTCRLTLAHTLTYFVNDNHDLGSYDSNSISFSFPNSFVNYADCLWQCIDAFCECFWLSLTLCWCIWWMTLSVFALRWCISFMTLVVFGHVLLYFVNETNGLASHPSVYSEGHWWSLTMCWCILWVTQEIFGHLLLHSVSDTAVL